MAVCLICSVASGVALPLMTVIFGNLQSDFAKFFTGQISHDDFTHTMSHTVLYFVYLAIAEYVTAYISVAGFMYTGEHISGKIRSNYLASCLRQNMGFFDKLGAGEVTTRITDQTNTIQDGISEKVAVTVAAMATFVAAFVIGFIEYWKLTLILTSTFVALVTVMGASSRFVLKYSQLSMVAQARSGSVAEEVLSSVRNAIAFGTQDRLARQYDQHLTRAEHSGFRQRVALACMLAFMMCILYLNYGLAFWMGSRFIIDGSTTVGKVITVMMVRTGKPLNLPPSQGRLVGSQLTWFLRAS